MSSDRRVVSRFASASAWLSRLRSMLMRIFSAPSPTRGDGWGWMGVSTPAIVRLLGGFVGNATGDFVADFYERRWYE